MKPNFSDFSDLADLLFQPTAGQVYSDMAGELAILDSKTGVYYGLDPVGARVWSLMLEWKNVGEICAALLEEYDVAAAQLKEDIAHLFHDLFAKGLVQLAPPGAKPPPKGKRAIPRA